MNNDHCWNHIQYGILVTVIKGRKGFAGEEDKKVGYKQARLKKNTFRIFAKYTNENFPHISDT